MSKAEGSWIWFLLLSGLCNTTLAYMYNDNVVIHTRMRITGGFKVYFLSVHMANLLATGLKLLALLQFAPKTFETTELEHEVPCHLEATKLIARSDSDCLACSLLDSISP